ncbi:hypothetical protein Q8F55_008811 [Vanrija albida]|uniref:DNA replication checkpoint mediator MRC1 domain-containing protein n=1 Tax=Vanrija albida TaxID=181172 RepID=A0ABR3PRV8_9TREE
MKPLKKADQEQLRRDVSKAKRERPVTLSRTQTERRPVSEWLQRADGAVRTQALPPAASTPEDIQQFPPSSLPAQRSSDPAGPGRTVNFQKPTSSPTPLARRPTGIPATSAASDSDSEPEDILQALEKAERKSERKKNLDGIKRKAMEAKALRRAEPNGSDDELSVLPVTTTSKVGTKASTPQSIISGRIAAAAPNKQKQNLMRISGARVGAGRRVVTETHLQFAGKDFDHANQKMANAGSRPAGQKQGRDNIISQLQMQAQMQANHKKQVLDLKTAKERQFGKGRQLPAKQAIDLAAMTNGLAQHGSDQDDMASDEGDSDYDPEPHSGDEGDLIIGDDVDDAASNGSVVGDSVVQPTSREETPQADTNPGRNRQVAFVDPEDDEPDLVTQPRRHPSRRARRVAADSESETEDAEPPAPQTATEIGTAASNVTVGFGDFGDGFGADGFSQLFETTQAAVGSENDGLAGLRNDNGGLLPEHAALPGVQMSESQARRDNALVAGELENPASQAVQQQQAGNQYLNSQGDAAFVDEQAEESDEDNAWGFGKADDDEDDGMDEGYIPDLLDDAVVDAEEREKQKALADAKLREIAQEDDARREAEAKKITDGHYRHKRRGNDFLSDEEDDESRSRRLTKKQRRQRKLEREDGLYKLDGESNAFLKEYERDLESDNEFEESVEEPAALHSPSRDALSSREVHELIRLNREEIEIEHHSDEESESLVTIARRTRVTTLATTDAEVDTLVTSRVSKQTTRSTESYMMFLKDQSSNAGRGGSGRGGVSVVQKANPGAGHAPLHRSKTSSTHDLGQRTGRVLIDKTTRFN